MKESINEFFWMWISSIFPILFGSFLIKLFNNELDYLGIIKNSVGVDLIFAYVATMISPFLYMLSRWATNQNYRKELKSIKYCGTCIVLSFFIALTTTAIFSVAKGPVIKNSIEKLATEKEISNNIQLENRPYKSDNKTNLNESERNISEFWERIGFSNKVLIVCYILALLIWFYSIYLKNLEPPNIETDGQVRVKGLMNDVSSVTGGE